LLSEELLRINKTLRKVRFKLSGSLSTACHRGTPASIPGHCV